MPAFKNAPQEEVTENFTDSYEELQYRCQQAKKTLTEILDTISELPDLQKRLQLSNRPGSSSNKSKENLAKLIKSQFDRLQQLNREFDPQQISWSVRELAQVILSKEQVTYKLLELFEHGLGEADSLLKTTEAELEGLLRYVSTD